MSKLVGRYLEHLTWPEAEAAFTEEPVIVLPLGARTKEHGRHLPLNNDWLIAEYLAKRIAALKPVLVLPTLQYAHYPAFSEYPGSVTLSSDTFRDTVVQICQSVARHGPKQHYVINTGISTLPGLRAAQGELEKLGVELRFTDLGRDFGEKRLQLSEQAAGTHADEIEASMMLYIAPDVVKMEHATKDVHADHGSGGLTRDANARRGVYSPSGAYGDPTLATLEKGREVVEHMVEVLAGVIDDIERGP